MTESETPQTEPQTQPQTEQVSSAPVMMPQPKVEPQPGIVYTTPPKADSWMTPEENAAAIKNFMSAVSADPRHPYWGGHLLTADYRKYFKELHEIREGLTKDKPALGDVLVQELKEKQRREQEDRVKDAQADMDAIVATGLYQRAEIPSDISASTAKLLKIQRYFAEGKLDIATNLLRMSYAELKVPIEVQQAFATLSDLAGKDIETRQMHTDNVIRWLDNKYRELNAKKELPKYKKDSRSHIFKKTAKGDYIL